MPCNIIDTLILSPCFYIMIWFHFPTLIDAGVTGKHTQGQEQQNRCHKMKNQSASLWHLVHIDSSQTTSTSWYWSPSQCLHGPASEWKTKEAPDAWTRVHEFKCATCLHYIQSTFVWTIYNKTPRVIQCHSFQFNSANGFHILPIFKSLFVILNSSGAALHD